MKQDFWNLNAHVESLAETGNSFWGFYSAVVLGVLTVVVSVRHDEITTPERQFLAVALAVFFIYSLGLIYSNNKLLDAATISQHIPRDTGTTICYKLVALSETRGKPS